MSRLENNTIKYTKRDDGTNSYLGLKEKTGKKYALQLGLLNRSAHRIITFCIESMAKSNNCGQKKALCIVLSQALGLTESKVYKALKQLENDGYLVKYEGLLYVNPAYCYYYKCLNAKLVCFILYSGLWLVASRLLKDCLTEGDLFSIKNHFYYVDGKVVNTQDLKLRYKVLGEQEKVDKVLVYEMLKD